MADEKLLSYPVGSVIQFTSGCWSDFGTVGMIVTIKPCNLPALAQSMTGGKSKHGADAGHYDFAGWLIANGYAMPVDCAAVHLGDYSDWEPEFGVKYKDD